MTFQSQAQTATGAALAESGELLPADATLIDVRSYAEYMGGHLPGALCLPLPQLEQEIAHKVPEHGRPVILYCATGARSELALGLMRQLGYTDAHNGGGAVQLAARLHKTLQRGL
jgi:phage shock protein E